MAYKKKTLPKDFEDLLNSGDIEALKAIFKTCDINAKGGVFKQPALAFSECTDEFTKWLVECGADLSAGDKYGDTPLHSRSGHWKGRLDILLELGADVNNSENERGTTPLHNAAGAGHVENVRVLLNHGASPNALNKNNVTPLIYALQHCANIKIEQMARIAELLIEAVGKQVPEKTSFFGSVFGSNKRQNLHQTSEAKELIVKIGTNFEFHRNNFNPDSVKATSTALEKLYALFDVPPVPRRLLHDGKTPIVASAKRLTDQHQELWELLVPSSGAAKTVQGEVIRISGKVSRELEGNGGVNWDKEFKKMTDAFLQHVCTGKPLPNSAQIEAREIVSEVKAKRGDTQRMCELATLWVGLNPNPIKLPTPDYNR